MPVRPSSLFLGELLGTCPLGCWLHLGWPGASEEMTCRHSLHLRAAGQGCADSRTGPLHDCCRISCCHARSPAT
uniref:Putative secreted protein n=1 Tax=Ixodes ricinus TaxID=34613 RepID=A0A6B0U4J5_IXORI